MAQPTTLPAKKASRRQKPQLEVYPPSVPRCLFRGNEVSVYYNPKQAGAWARQRRDQVIIALFFSANLCRFGWKGPGGKWEIRDVRGPHVCAIAAGRGKDLQLFGGPSMTTPAKPS